MPALAESIKNIAGRSRWLLIAYIVYIGFRLRLRFRFGKIDSFSGSSHSTLTVAQSVGYVNEVFDDFVQYGSLTDELIRGKRFLEVGAGDNVGVALRFLARGAREYICLDRFFSIHDVEVERQIYLTLRGQLPERERAAFDESVKLETRIGLNPDKTHYVYGKGAEEAREVFPDECFDFILSRVVLQEIFDLDRAFAAMDALLVPGGMLIHKVDLRDYGMFSGRNYNPREYLTISDWIYELMARNASKSNRKLIDYYRDKMKELGYSAQFYITSVVEVRGYHGITEEITPAKTSIQYGVDYNEQHRRLVAEVRPRLRPQFRGLPEEDILAASIFLVATKPAAGA